MHELNLACILHLNQTFYNAKKSSLTSSFSPASEIYLSTLLSEKIQSLQSSKPWFVLEYPFAPSVVQLQRLKRNLSGWTKSIKWITPPRVYSIYILHARMWPPTNISFFFFYLATRLLFLDKTHNRRLTERFFRRFMTDIWRIKRMSGHSFS